MGRTQYTLWVYDISDGNDGNAFSIRTITGTIAVELSSAINRESSEPFLLTVRAFEERNAVQSAFMFATIELVDIHDISVHLQKFRLDILLLHPLLPVITIWVTAQCSVLKSI